jgi:hypothetical protein
VSRYWLQIASMVLAVLSFVALLAFIGGLERL